MDFFEEPKTGQAAFSELKRQGARISKPNVYRECDLLAEMGFLSKEADGYQAVAESRRRLTVTVGDSADD